MFLDEIIDKIGKLHKVDFKNPQYTIFTDISKVFIFIFLELYDVISSLKL